MDGRVSHKDYWEEIAKKEPKAEGEVWTNRYIENASTWAALKILDLGCGRGYETAYCMGEGHDVVSADLALGMIMHLQSKVPGSKGIVFDMAKSDWEIFKTNQFDAVIASLSLHYFDERTTARIIKEIQRVLRPGGKLYARVNSAYDFAYGAGNGDEIERNFYVDRERGTTKRYFDEKDVKRFFEPLGDLKYEEMKITYFGGKKVVFEIVVENKKSTSCG